MEVSLILLIYIFKINTLVFFPIEKKKKKNNAHSNHFKKKKVYIEIGFDFLVDCSEFSEEPHVSFQHTQKGTAFQCFSIFFNQRAMSTQNIASYC